MDLEVILKATKCKFQKFFIPNKVQVYLEFIQVELKEN